MLKELEYPAYPNGGAQRISWGAVLAGAVSSLATLLALISLAAGAGLLGAPAAVAGGAVLAAGIVSFYAGGWIAGRMTGIARVSESVLHGFVSWAAATVASAFLLATVLLRAFGGEPVPLVGAPGAFGFLLLALSAAASCYGARNGTRLLRPVPMPVPEARRERISL